ncbi:MAG TPA: hypothetical protein VGT08_07920 [Terracidiphilus sp.]|nr:hypothetical protein [Terracidiphilus sp.]
MGTNDCGAVAANGGMMGNAKQGLTKRKKTSSKTRDGGEQLRTAVEKLVAEQSEKIAQALIDKTIEGNMTGARLLVDLSGAKSPQTKPPKKRRGLTTAQRLAMDKPWEGQEDGEENLSPRPHETVA